MKPKLAGAMFAAMMIALFFELLSLWIQFDRNTFGRGGWGFDLLRDKFETSPAEVVFRLRAGFELAVLSTLGCLFEAKVSEEK